LNARALGTYARRPGAIPPKLMSKLYC
jgi:hypothetical protein